MPQAKTNPMQKNEIDGMLTACSELSLSDKLL